MPAALCFQHEPSRKLGRAKILNIDVYLSIADISGVCIAFGGLISALSDTSKIQRILLRGMVSTGLVVLIASLTPVGFSFFPIPTDTAFRITCGLFLILIWTVILGARDKELEPIAVQYMKSHYPVLFIIFAIEVFIQVPLIVSILGFFSSYWEAFLALALLLNLLQGAIFLSLMVFAKNAKET